MTLAILGGEPVFPEGPPAWPPSDPAVREALEQTYRDGTWGRYDGRNVAELTERLSAAHGGCRVWCCSSGTAAVELALRGLRIGSGDEVLVAGYDYPGNFRCIEAVGGRPVLVDIRPDGWSLDAGRLDEAYQPCVRAVIVSHLHGSTAAMHAIRSWADERGVAVIEDACQVPGAQLDGRMAGTWGDVGVLSFGGSKLLTAGRGGALLTRREDVLQRIKIFCERGSNAFPLSELQAAVLLPQLAALAARNHRRLENARILVAACRDIVWLKPAAIPGEQRPAFYKLGWYYRPSPEACLPERDRFLQAVRAEGVALDRGFRGFVHRTPRRCRRAAALTHSRAAAEQTAVLHHPVLLESGETMQRVADALRKVIDGLAAFRTR